MTATLDAVPAEGSSASSTASLQPDAPIRVVVADDSAAIRTLLRYSLTSGRGFNLVGEATNGTEALSLTRTHLPDCVVLDIEMPGMGGLEALIELRQSHPSIPVVMLSGFLDPSVRASTSAAGASATLDKSTDLKQLPETVRHLLSQLPDPASLPSSAPASSAPAAGLSPTTTPAPAAGSDTDAAELRRLEYVVGHDLGEPVRVISGFTNLLRERYADDLNDSGKAFLDDISDAALRLRGMLDDLLTYGRAGHRVPAPEQLDVQEVVRQVYDDLSSTISAKGAVATVGQTATVFGDRDLLATVLSQAVINAVSFNTSTVPEVRAAAVSDGLTTTITVQDNGIGIQADHCERVFGLFQRLNTREEYAGNGVGLALCRRLVTMQGGSVAITSVDGEGTCLTVSLPTSPAASAASDVTGPGEPSTPLPAVLPSADTQPQEAS